jgi:adenosylcobinamide kinase / adenosylcobinamide-phosphate guanylyltransferase
VCCLAADAVTSTRIPDVVHMDSARTVMLVLGGVRSGKSRYAQAQASRFDRVTFVATARRSDAEMRRKIAAHRRERPRAWKTVEAHRNLDRVIFREGASTDLLLVDCLTTYCGGLLSRRGLSPAHRAHLASVIEAIGATRASVFLVSNEVGSGVVPAFKSGRLFRDALGELNQQVALVATHVVLLVAGLPVAIKGRL